MYYISYKTPAKMKEYGFEVDLVHKRSGMRQHGSLKNFTCFLQDQEEGNQSD